MDAVVLYRGQRRLQSRVVRGYPVEIGRHRACDLVVEDPRLRERHLLIRRQDFGVVAYDLGTRGGGRPTPLAAGVPIRLGAEHHLVRLADERSHRSPTPCEIIEPTSHEGQRFVLIVGAGPEARRQPIGEAPIAVGAAEDNDLCIADRSVSRHHLRLDPCDAGVLLRDLESRNGTWTDGARVERLFLRHGMQIRVGRTDLSVIDVAAAPSPRLRWVIASPTMQRLMATVERHARLPWPTLIFGESGVGKEGIARALHDRGPRRSGPFVAVNAGALGDELCRSELFGHVKGAFTGASSARRGAFEMANGGTLFLDEVGELPLSIQVQLLRVLETWQVQPLGGEDLRNVDVRLICATHRPLREMVKEGRFREDLYYRLNGGVLIVPPLRERAEDRDVLAQHFLHEVADHVGVRQLSPEALCALGQHDWPGNVRELRNVIRMAAVHAHDGIIGSRDIDRALGDCTGGSGPPPLTDAKIKRALAESGGNCTAAARSLGVARSTLRWRMKGLGKRQQATSVPDSAGAALGASGVRATDASSRKEESPADPADQPLPEVATATGRYRR